MKNWYIVQTFSGFEQKVAEVIKDSVKKAYAARLKKLGRKPRTAKEHEEWRKKQRQKFKLW